MSIISSSTTILTGLEYTSDTSGTLDLKTGSTPTSRLYIDATGNVGIGTSSPSAARLHVVGVSGGYVQKLNNVNSTRVWAFGVDKVSTNDGIFVIDDVTAGVNRLCIDTSGNIGAGATPYSYGTSKLTLYGTGNAGIIGYVYNPGSTQSYLNFGNGDTGVTTNFSSATGGMLVGVDSDSSATVWTYTNTFMKFGTNGQERFRIDSDGVRIAGGGDLRISDSSAPTTTANDTYIYNDGATLIAWVNGGPKFKISSSGNVGIGTESPSRNLHVYGNTASDVFAKVTSTYADGYDAGILLENTHTGGRLYAIVSTNNSRGTIGGGRFAIIDKTAGAASHRLVIDSSGSVGIGTTSPISKFHVEGGKTTLASTDNSFGQLQIGNSNSGAEAAIGFVSGATGYGAGPTSVGGNEYVWALGAGVGTIGGNSFGLYNKNVGSHVMSIDAAGKMTLPYQPAFLAQHGGFSKSASWERITGFTESYDISSNWDNANSRFTAPKAGRYMFYAGGWAAYGTDGARFAMSATVNGGNQTYITGGNYSDTDSPMPGYTVVLSLAANDYVDIYGYSAVSTTWGTSSHRFFFGGYFLG